MSKVTIERTLLILKRLADENEGIGVRDTAKMYGMSPAAVQQILTTMDEHNFAEKDEQTQLYKIGPAAVEIGLKNVSKMTIREVARPFLKELAQRVGETALLAIIKKSEAIYVDKCLSSQEIRMDPQIGGRRPLNCTAVGKSFLANMSQEEVLRLSEKGQFIKSTVNSKTDLPEIEADLDRIRVDGYAVDNEEYLEGAMCVGAPILNRDGFAVASLAASGPADRMRNNLEEIIKVVLEIKGKIQGRFLEQ